MLLVCAGKASQGRQVFKNVKGWVGGLWGILGRADCMGIHLAVDMRESGLASAAEALRTLKQSLPELSRCVPNVGSPLKVSGQVPLCPLSS